MNFGDKVFVVTPDGVVEGSIRHSISHQGVVTGYELSGEHFLAPITPKFAKRDVFTDEEAANKALFVRSLKADKERKVPSEDVRGDRHWIPGHRKSWRTK